jgi:hypothetical protein
VAAVLGLARAPLADGLRWIDRVWLHERIMDTLARLRGDEDWSLPQPLHDAQDYTWTRGSRPLRIAHALGESGLPAANTIGALQRSYDAGLRVFEVDLVLDDGVLTCQHDPGPATTPRAQDACTLDRLLDVLPGDAWVVLDLKTDFEPAALAAIAAARRAGRLDRLVFQLYAPGQVERFAAWQAAYPALPGPVLTTYLAHRSLGHILTQARRLHIQAVTLPLARLPALPADRQGALVLVHPIHDCAAAAQARVDGHYTLRSLHCGPSAPFPQQPR